MFIVEIIDAVVLYDGRTPIKARMSDSHFPSLFVTVFINQMKPIIDGSCGYEMAVSDIPHLLHSEDVVQGVYYPDKKIGQCKIDHPAFQEN